MGKGFTMSYRTAIELIRIRDGYDKIMRETAPEAQSKALIYAAGAQAITKAMEELADKGLIPYGELWEAPDGEHWFGVDGESIFTRVRDGYARRRSYVEQDYGHLVRIKPTAVALD